MNLTKEQEAAISARGQVIVSASAGSGKTFVMIKRLVSLILGGADVRSVLAVTFTEKAAAQMRDRLRSALIEGLGSATGEDKKRLKEQLAALPLAQVSTLHAFCARLVRANFFLAGVDASYRIIAPDDPVGSALRSRAVDEVLEDAYEKKDSDLMALLPVYFRKKDARLREHILTLYDKVRENADYKALLSPRPSRYEEGCEEVKKDFLRRIEEACQRAERAAAFLEGNKRAELVANAIFEIGENLRAPDLFTMISRAEGSIPTMPSKAKAEGETLQMLNLLSSAAAETRGILRELNAFLSPEEEKNRCLLAERCGDALCSLVSRFDDAYSRLKEEENVLDYNDLEHLALKVLSDENTRAELSSRYRYVFVDEYQDINPVQDRILSAFGGGDVFFVGDSKQAIYAFRGSNSGFFDKKTQTLPVSLTLSENFRSSSAVLQAVNDVFASREGYLPMRGGARYGENRGEVKFVEVAKTSAEKPENRGVYTVLGDMGAEKPDPTAERVAALIEEEVSSGTYFDADQGTEKRVTFGDIAVLVRKRSSLASEIVRALEKRDIPVTTTNEVNVCDFFEARLVLDALSYLDNAEQDIPLASFLLSAAGGMTEEELAEIRLKTSSSTFREACRTYAEERTDGIAEKLNSFFRLTESLRDYARTHNAAETAGVLLSLGLEAQIASKRDGELRLARVRRLLAEAESCGSVHAFLARLKATGNTLRYAGGDAEGAVKVVTMHASKGLEYPVVFLAGMDETFHSVDSDEILWTDRFGLALKSYDVKKKIVSGNILRRASILVRREEECVGERNLLYVAMTRAKYRLYLLFEERDRSVPPFTPNRYSELIDCSACADYFVRETGGTEPPKREILPIAPDPAGKEKVLSCFHMPYAFAGAADTPVKSSATDLLRQGEEDFERDEEAKYGTSAEIGTAYHAFLQYVRFGEDVKKELERMEEEGLLSKEQIALLDEKKLRAILALPCMQLKGKTMFREQKFLLKLPAREMLGLDSDDEVIYQGAIDLLVEENGNYRIVDYKFSARTDESLKRHYAPQILLYKKATAKILGAKEEDITATIVNLALLREIKM